MSRVFNLKELKAKHAMPSMRNVLDIIIVTYNCNDCLQECLWSIVCDKSIQEYQIHVVNNGYRKGLELLTTQFPNTSVINNSENIGFARAVNQALNRCSAPFICILNPDTLINEGFLRDTLGYLKRHNTVGLLGPKIYDGDGSVQGSARSFPTILTTFFGRTSWLTRRYPKNSISKKNILNINNQSTYPIDVDWVSGACMIVRHEAVRTIGGLDERFFMYWEDADWCRRLREGGWRVVYYPDTSISHSCGESSKRRPFKSLYHFHKSCYQLYAKHAKSYQTFFLPFAILGLFIRLMIAMAMTSINQKNCAGSDNK